MLRIVDRYLARELLVSFLGATLILLLITLGGTVADLLSKIARGRIPADLLLALIGLRTVDALQVLAPLAVFIGVQLAYGRLWRESEMAVFAASGLPLTGLLRPLLLLAVPLMIVMALISFWFAPAAVRASQALLQEASRSLIIAGLEPGRFVELPNHDGVMYVDTMNADGTQFKKMFVASERSNKDENTTDLNVITATSGELFHDANGVERYLGLNDGFRVEGVIGQDNYRLMRYQRNDIKLPDNETDTSAESVKRAATTADMLRSDDPVQRAELHWRIAMPLMCIVLTLLAVPLGRLRPRQGRYARVWLAVVIYFLYSNLISAGKAWIARGTLPEALGLWWTHAAVVLLALAVIMGPGLANRLRYRIRRL